MYFYLNAVNDLLHIDLKTSKGGGLVEDLQTTDHVTGERLLIKGEKLLAVREINGNCCELTLESSGGCIEALRVREGYGSLAQKLGIDLKPEGLEDLKGENWIKMDRLLKRYV